MRRIKLELAYDGTNYHGWQRQPDVPTVQERLETVLQRITGERISVTGSGRTDAGVHALKQVAAFSTGSHLEASVFQRALNGFLPGDIRILRAEEVPLTFHPISCAVSKRYRYLIDDSRPAFPMTRNHCWVHRKSLSWETMQEAARHLVGKRDFACFETTGSPRSTTVRTVFDATVKRLTPFDGFFPPMICVEVQADGFLYNMMRAMTGTLVLLALENKPERMSRIIESRDRSQAGPTAPPQGLYLVDVEY